MRSSAADIPTLEKLKRDAERYLAGQEESLKQLREVYTQRLKELRAGGGKVPETLQDPGAVAYIEECLAGQELNESLYFTPSNSLLIGAPEVKKEAKPAPKEKVADWQKFIDETAEKAIKAVPEDNLAKLMGELFDIVSLANKLDGEENIKREMLYEHTIDKTCKAVVATDTWDTRAEKIAQMLVHLKEDAPLRDAVLAVLCDIACGKKEWDLALFLFFLIEDRVIEKAVEDQLEESDWDGVVDPRLFSLLIWAKDKGAFNDALLQFSSLSRGRKVFDYNLMMALPHMVFMDIEHASVTKGLLEDVVYDKERRAGKKLLECFDYKTVLRIFDSIGVEARERSVDSFNRDLVSFVQSRGNKPLTTKDIESYIRYFAKYHQCEEGLLYKNLVKDLRLIFEMNDLPAVLGNLASLILRKDLEMAGIALNLRKAAADWIITQKDIVMPKEAEDHVEAVYRAEQSKEKEDKAKAKLRQQHNESKPSPNQSITELEEDKELGEIEKPAPALPNIDPKEFIEQSTFWTAAQLQRKEEKQEEQNSASTKNDDLADYDKREYPPVSEQEMAKAGVTLQGDPTASIMIDSATEEGSWGLGDYVPANPLNYLWSASETEGS